MGTRHHGHPRLRDASENHGNQEGYTYLVYIAIDTASLSDVPVYVVPDDSCKRELLIGRPWCEHPEIAYIKFNDQLTFYNINDFPFAVNPTINDDHREESALRANEFLSKGTRDAVVASATGKPFERELAFEDIGKPNILVEQQQQELLQLVSEHARCFALHIGELDCTTLG